MSSRKDDLRTKPERKDRVRQEQASSDLRTRGYHAHDRRVGKRSRLPSGGDAVRVGTEPLDSLEDWELEDPLAADENDDAVVAEDIADDGARLAERGESVLDIDDVDALTPASEVRMIRRLGQRRVVAEVASGGDEVRDGDFKSRLGLIRRVIRVPLEVRLLRSELLEIPTWGGEGDEASICVLPNV